MPETSGDPTLRPTTDWEEVAKMLAESYRLAAPRSLVVRMEASRPG
ncbi:MAG TPA: hypothetical protein VHJ78_10125 [Actinomycetota bacterium]|nr:hypothetical protein [Actinomycetota bacterium]